MNTHTLSLAAAAAFALLAAPAAAQTRRPEPDLALDAAARATTLDSVLARIDQAYVIPAKAKEMVAAVRARQQRGEYDRITSAAELADSLTSHLRAVSHDLHLSVAYTHDPLPRRAPAQDDTALVRRRAAWAAYANAGFERVERLPGNVGYIKVDGFTGADDMAAAAKAAMGFVANTDALILDLRDNRGGRPEGVAALASWLFSRPVHLNSIWAREGSRTTHFWTTRVETPYGDLKPVYVLVSRETFSAGEELPYDLQARGRALVVGETTGGGAHPVSGLRATDHFLAIVPSRRAVNPVTHTNWEGIGVRPDIPTSSVDALTTAHRLALRALLVLTHDAMRQDGLKDALAALGDAPDAAATTAAGR